MKDDDDDLLNALGDLLGEQDDEDVQLLAALEAGEAIEGVDPALLAALGPLDVEELGTIQAAVRPPVEAVVEPEPPVVEAPAPDNVLPFRRWWLAGAGALAAAAAVVFFVLRPGVPGLPRYELSVRGHGAQTFRSGDAGPAAERPAFREGTRFDFVLRPASKVVGDVELRATRVQGATRARWDAPLERDPGGALRVTGTVGADLPAEPGDWTLVFEVSRAGAEGQRFEVPIRVLK